MSARERRVAALVVDRRPAVDPHARPVVDGAEVQQQPLPWAAEPRERPPVPDDRVEAPIADPARGRLGRERHLDLCARHVRALHQPSSSPTPSSSYAKPHVPDRSVHLCRAELGTRMNAPGHRPVHSFFAADVSAQTIPLLPSWSAITVSEGASLSSTTVPPAATAAAIRCSATSGAT